METKYILNHFYIIRHDGKRSHIMASNQADKVRPQGVHQGWASLIHPVLAMALTFFAEPQTLEELKKQFAYFFDIPDDEALKFVSLFLNNEENFTVTYDGKGFVFPNNIIIDASTQSARPVRYTPEQFAYKELDLERERYYLAPATIVFMVNNTCATDCIYCYANKTVKSGLIGFDRLKDIVKEARELQVTKFALVGGEVFLYERWKELLALLSENDLNETLVSTKVPITENDIIALKDFNLSVQVSLDAVDSGKLQKILNVKPGYADKIKHTVRLLNEHKINFQISTVLTVYNGCIDELKDLYEFLRPFGYLKRWEIRVAFRSLYSRGDFDTIKLPEKEIEKIDTWISDLRKQSDMDIEWSARPNDKYFKGENGSRSFLGSRCSANYSNLFILPDGNVSICEQLYWDPRFIIGNLTTQTIREVWNSPRALELAFPKKETVSDKSICKTCNIFDECMYFPNRCIADILKGYGMENPDFPDPRCNKAPRFTHSLLNE